MPVTRAKLDTTDRRGSAARSRSTPQREQLHTPVPCDTIVAVSDNTPASNHPAPPDADPFRSVRRGLLDLAVLSCLRSGRLYPAEIRDRLASTPFATREGTLYPLLGKLRRDGLLDHEWVESEHGPPRKYHGLTDAGSARLAELDAYWHELTTTLRTLGAPE